MQTDADIMLTIFEEIFHEIILKHAPIIKVLIKNKKPVFSVATPYDLKITYILNMKVGHFLMTNSFNKFTEL